MAEMSYQQPAPPFEGGKLMDAAPADQGYAERLIRCRCPELGDRDLGEALDMVRASPVGAVMALVENIEDRLAVAERKLADADRR
jgi:hypothetical protein